MPERRVVLEGEVAELARHSTAAGLFIRVKIVAGEYRESVYVRPESAAGLSLGQRVRLVLEVLP